MVFSFYAKGRDDRDRVAFVGFGLTKTQKTFQLSGHWERYHLCFDVTPTPHRDLGGRVYVICPAVASTVWISGLQLERGDKPTAFRDDSVLRERTVDEDPTNLIRNGHAEYGDARFWSVSDKPGTFVSTEARTGRFAFRTDSPHIHFNSDIFSIAQSATYELTGAFKARPRSCRLIYGLLLYDSEKRQLRSLNINSVKDTETALAAPCAKGDRVLKVRDGSSWSARHYVAFEPEKGVPNFSVTGMTDAAYQSGKVWLIKLREPCAFEFPAGTRVVAHRAGTNGVFPCVVEVGERWTDVRGEITPAMLRRWPGATFARAAVMPKLPSDRSVEFFADDLRLTRRSAE